MVQPGTILRRIGAAFFLASAMLAACTASAKDKWRAYTYNAVSTVTAAKGLKAMLDEIQVATKGELTVRLNLGGTIPIAATNITQAVADNVVQMGDDTFFLGSVPVGGVVRLPMFLRTRAEFDRAWSIEEKYLRAEYAKKNVTLLGHYTFPENVFWSKNKMTTLADIAGQKIRVISPEQAEFITMLGGIPVTLGTAEVATAIDRGVVDGVLTASSGYGYIWRDLLAYSYRLNVSYIDSLILVNTDAWKALSPATRAQVQAVVDEHTSRITQEMAREDGELTRKLAAAGMVITEPSAADLVEAERRITPYWKQWGEQRPSVAAALQEVRAAVGR